MTKTVAYLGLGSNLGDRMAALEKARALLQARGFAMLARRSTWQSERCRDTSEVHLYDRAEVGA